MIRKITMVLLAALLFSAAALVSCNKASGASSLTDEPSSGSSLASGSNSFSKSDSNSKSITSSSSGQASSVSDSANDSSGSSKSSSSKSQSSIASSIKSTSSSSSPAVIKNHYVSGSWNAYLVNDENYLMQPVAGSTTWYTITVTLTTDLRKDYAGTEGPGHWYKVTEGNWDFSYGIDNYCVTPAPIEYTSAGVAIGMGSVYIKQANGAPAIVLTIMFDSVNKIVYDDADGKTLPVT